MGYIQEFKKWQEKLENTPYASELASMTEAEKESCFGASLQFGTACAQSSVWGRTERTSLPSAVPLRVWQIISTQ